MKYFRSLILVVAALFASSAGAQPKFTEAQVKAAFVYKVSFFIEWNKKNVRFCALDDSLDENGSVANFLKELIEQKDGGYSFKSFASVDNIKGCDILYINPNKDSVLLDILSATNGKQIATVSDVKNFSRRGGIFGFYTTDDNKIKMEVNYKNAKTNGLNVSSSLLEMIRVVDE